MSIIRCRLILCRIHLARCISIELIEVKNIYFKWVISIHPSDIIIVQWCKFSIRSTQKKSSSSVFSSHEIPMNCKQDLMWSKSTLYTHLRIFFSTKVKILCASWILPVDLFAWVNFVLVFLGFLRCDASNTSDGCQSNFFEMPKFDVPFN